MTKSKTTSKIQKQGKKSVPTKRAKTSIIRKAGSTNRKVDSSQTSIIKIKLTGKGGHGSTPHKIIDPISGAMQVFEALHTIMSRNIDSSKDVVIMIGRV